METPNFAAMEAQTDAIRLQISRIESGDGAPKLVPLRHETFALNLACDFSTPSVLEEDGLIHIVEGFTWFRELLNDFNVEEFRAVATSPFSDAKNFQDLLEMLLGDSEILLEPIDSAERANLLCASMRHALQQASPNGLIVELGDFELKLDEMKKGLSKKSYAIPCGPVKLFRQKMTAEEVPALVHESLRKIIGIADTVFACGGWANLLTAFASSQADLLDLELLATRSWKIETLDNAQRMKHFKVNEAQAEVMHLAAAVMRALGELLKAKQIRLLQTGLLDGMLMDLAQAKTITA